MENTLKNELNLLRRFSNYFDFNNDHSLIFHQKINIIKGVIGILKEGAHNYILTEEIGNTERKVLFTYTLSTLKKGIINELELPREQANKEEKYIRKALEKSIKNENKKPLLLISPSLQSNSKTQKHFCATLDLYNKQLTRRIEA